MAENLSQNDPVQESFNLKSFFGDRIKIGVAILFLFGLFLLTFGAGMFLLKGSTHDNDIQIISSEGSETLKDKIVVHVDGAVNRPGVYELGADLRVNDLVDLAGGLTKDADSSQINLAAKLADGQKIYIPSINDPASSKYPDPVSGYSSGLININTATESQLDTLPAIGPVTAGKIIASRPYSTIDELVSKKAVGSATFGKIKELITVY